MRYETILSYSILSGRKLASLLLSIVLYFCASAQDTISIISYGYTPGSRINAVPFVKKALIDCKGRKNAVLVFPKGRYDFWPQYAEEKQYFESNSDVIPTRRCPILIEGFQQLTIDAMQSDFVYHDRQQPFTIDSSSNIRIKNVNIDWDVPLTAQAQVVAVNDNYIDIAINILESPYVIENGKLVFVGEGWKSQLWGWGVMEFEKDSKLIPQETGDASCLGEDYDNYKATELHYGLVRMNYQFKRKPALGNYLVLRHSARDHAGVFIINSNNISIENLNMFHNSGLGILSQYSENLHFKNVNSVPNLAKGRILSGHDDGFHYSNCKGQIIVDSCRFLALMDDPINVHGTSVQIIQKIDEKKLLCKFMHHQSIGFVWARKGETIGFIENEAMNSFATNIVESFKAISPELFEISFRDPIAKETMVGDALENLSWAPDVLIKNSFFGSNRARGILISTPGKVLVENNVFESSGAAILIAGDANGWFESGAVKDVTIRNNVFNDPCLTSMYQFCEGIISIYPEIPKMDPAKPFHRNIKIENNYFHPFDYPLLYARSTQGLFFNNNTITRSNRFKSFHQRKFMITLEYCKAVEVKGNKMIGEVLGRNIKLVGTAVRELSVDKSQKLLIEK